MQWYYNITLESIILRSAIVRSQIDPITPIHCAPYIWSPVRNQLRHSISEFEDMYQYRNIIHESLILRSAIGRPRIDQITPSHCAPPIGGPVRYQLHHGTRYSYLCKFIFKKVISYLWGLQLGIKSGTYHRHNIINISHSIMAAQKISWKRKTTRCQYTDCMNNGY